MPRYLIEGSSDGSLFAEAIDAVDEEEAEAIAIERLCEAWGHEYSAEVELYELGDSAMVTPYGPEDYAREAAADMLALLKDALPLIADEVETRKESGMPAYYADLEKIEERMVAVIAKAEGRAA